MKQFIIVTIMSIADDEYPGNIVITGFHDFGFELLLRANREMLRCK
jgi:hypothetical protein